MVFRLLMGTTLMLFVCGPSRAGITYTFHQPVLFDSHPFGFFGTVTTDGSTGVLTTTDFIESWSITLFTPGTVDGVTSELLTPSNSTVSLFLSETPGLLVTPEAISMPPRGTVPLATLSWSTFMDDSTLQFTNRFTNGDGIGAGVSVFDPSEPNSALGIVSREAPVASIPEPLTSSMFLVGGTLLCISARRYLR